MAMLGLETKGYDMSASSQQTELYITLAIDRIGW